MANVIARYRFFNNQAVRFVFSAGAGFLMDISVFRFLRLYILTDKTYRVAGFNVNNHSLQLTISFFSGVMVNFLISRYLVFAESQTSATKQLVRFASISIVGYMASLGILNVLIGRAGMNPDLARLATALSLFSASFFIHKFFSFSLSSKDHAAATNNE